MKRISVLFLIGFALFLVGCSINDNKQNINKNSNQTLPISKQNNNDSAVKTDSPSNSNQNTNQSDSSLKTPVVVNCSDMACFLRAAKTCAPAKGIVVYNNQPLLNFLMSGKTEIEIKNGNNGMCIIYEKYLEASVKYSDKLIQLLLGQGKTMTEIKSMEASGNQGQQIAVGKDVTCVMTINDLVTKISNNMNGSIDMSTEHPGCTGTLYSGQ